MNYKENAKYSKPLVKNHNLPAKIEVPTWRPGKNHVQGIAKGDEGRGNNMQAVTRPIIHLVHKSEVRNKPRSPKIKCCYVQYVELTPAEQLPPDPRKRHPRIGGSHPGGRMK